MTKNRIIKILILLSYLIIFLLFFVYKIDIKCIFKKLFHIACPGCGLTRSINALLSLNIIESIKYNILGLPIVILVSSSAIIFIKEIIKDDDKLIPLLLKMLKKYYILLIVVLLIAMLINNINKI